MMARLLERLTQPAGPADALCAAFAARTARIGVVGLGHVGLPLACAVARAGFAAIGIDHDAAKIEAIGSGRSPFPHFADPCLDRLVATGRLMPSTSHADLAAADAVLLCVPTPLDAEGQPDLRHVRAASEAAIGAMRRGGLLVLESTTWPGTTRQVIAPMLAARGWQIGCDVFLAYSPEREDPGNPRYTTTAIPKLVAGAEVVSQRVAEALYGAIVEKVVPVASLETAEAAKLAENVFRAVNIALANELKQGFAAMGLDAWQITEAAATKPFGYMPFWPGPGPGGHCIPVDPAYLAWAARTHGASMPLTETAMVLNAAAPHGVVARAGAILGGLQGRRILLLGIAYKRNVADLRESPALVLMEAMEAAGATVCFHDPLVEIIPASAGHPGLAGRRSLSWSAALEAEWDAGLVATDHDAVDYAALLDRLPLIVDTRNAFPRRALHDARVVPA
jgi:UDP-N-acetyl-D-glucosamine dehydrogenase